MFPRILSSLRQKKLIALCFKASYPSINLGQTPRRLHVPASSTVRSVISSDLTIQEVANNEARVLKLIWNDGIESRYPYVFLRENCKCAECYEPSSKQRKVDVLKNETLNIKVQDVEIFENGEHLKCLWPDGHLSVYSAEWLHDRRMVRGREAKPKDIVNKDIVVWDKEEMQDKIPRYDYEDVMNNDKSLFDALYSFYQHGLMLVDNGPAREGVWKEMADRVGYVRPTHYGDYFDVKSKGDPNNLAYTNYFIPFHVDLLYLSRAPDVQVLHCVEQAGHNMGGESLFVDSFDVAKKLMEIDHSAFQALSTVHVPFQDVGVDVFGEFSLGFLRPIIELNGYGRMTGVMFNNFTRRDSFKNLTPEEILKFYDAYHQLNRMLYDPENTVRHLLKPGQMIFFHNTRVLHSRTAIEEGSSRLLQGNYYDWDVIFSKLRCIHARLSLEAPHLHGETNDFF